MSNRDHDEFDTKLRQKQERAASAAEEGFGAFAKSLQDVIGLQTDEIARLRKIIEDGTTIPERHPVFANLASRERNGGAVSHDIFAVANDKSLWLLPDAPTHPDQYKFRRFDWIRLPGLPSAADEMNARARRPSDDDDED